MLKTILGDPPAPECRAQIDVEKEDRFRAAVRGRVRPLSGVMDAVDLLKES